MISFFFSFCFCWLRYCTYYGPFGSWYGTFLLKGSYFCWMATRRTRRAIFGRISVISGKCNRWRGYYLWPFEKALEVFFFQCKECSGYQSSSTVNTLCQRSKLFFYASASRGQPQFYCTHNTGRSRSGNVAYSMCKVKVVFDCTCRKDNFNKVKCWLIYRTRQNGCRIMCLATEYSS